jgi:iron complex transport system permease protein
VNARRYNLTALIFVVAAATAIFLVAAFGAEPLVGSDILKPGTISHRIFFELRLPRILLACLIGGSLAALGSTYQTLFHNPLAEPYVLGVSSAVTLGIAIAQVFWHLSSQSIFAGLLGLGAGGILIAGLVLLSLARGERQMERLILFGMGLNFVLSSALFLLLSYSSQQVGGGSLRWIFGQVPWVSWAELGGLALVALPLLIAIAIYGRTLDALSLGDTVARTLGVEPVRSRAILLMLSSTALAAIVFFSGSIGFVGLVVPHGVRLVFRPSSSRSLLGLSFVLGGAFLCLADLVSRVVLPPLEFPIGIITTLVGGPLFLLLLWRNR